MNVYLAAAFSRRAELMIEAKRLIALGYNITSRWLEDTTTNSLCGFDRIDWAERDVEDVNSADILIRFTDPECRINDGLPDGFAPAKLMTGSRMWETGYAYAKGKRIIVVGGKQNIFDNLSSIEHVEDFNALEAVLGG